ncbi:MAG: methyltransferase domain-containing protein [Bacteroidales bacterium]
MSSILHRKIDFNKTIKSYRNVIWFYDFWSRLTESKALRTVMELVELKNGQNALEIGCGTGAVFEQIIIKNPDGYNLGVDISPDMLKKAKRRLQKVDSKNYELREGNILNLNFSENSFDVLISNFIIDLMPEETFDNIAKEFYKVLKQNGLCVISTFSFGTKRVHKFWYWIAKNIPGILTGCRPVTFKGHLEKAGFVILEDYQISQNTFPSEVIKAKKQSL